MLAATIHLFLFVFIIVVASVPGTFTGFRHLEKIKVDEELQALKQRKLLIFLA